MNRDKNALKAAILRYHHAEKWPVCTIARQLGVHHTTVDRVLSQTGQLKVERSQRPSILDPYLPFVFEKLQQFPNLSAARLYEMIKERGFRGGPSHFRHRIAELRPRPVPEAYLRLRTLAGEEAQVDWACCGHIEIGRAKRLLSAFVMVLSWCRLIFLRFFLNQKMENFLRGHEAAFNAWNGVPRILKYDNLRSAVLERRGDAIRFHPTLLDLSAHYRFEPKPVAIARGNEKGRVERAIYFIRRNFLAGRTWKNLDDLNTQATEWCWNVSADRPCPEDTSITVGEAFRQEQPRLIALPDNPFPTDECVEVSVGKTPYVRFDLNDYSIPHTHVRRTLTVMASLTEVRILHAGEVIARHRRHFGKGEQIEEPEHINELAKRKYQARRLRGQDQLSHAAPSSQALLGQAVERGNRLSTMVSSLLTLLDTYGATELEAAIAEALRQDTPHPNAVRLALQRRREQRQLPPPIPVAVPDHPKAKKLVVRSASLAAYDQLGQADMFEETTTTETTTLTDSTKGERSNESQ